MPSGVTVLGVIAAADMSAGQAKPEVHPTITQRKAFQAGVSRVGHHVDHGTGVCT